MTEAEQLPIVGVGTDLAQVERFHKFLKTGSRVVERVFSTEERTYALAKKDPAPHLAARFAAKEAFLKALGTGLVLYSLFQRIVVLFPFYTIAFIQDLFLS